MPNLPPLDLTLSTEAEFELQCHLNQLEKAEDTQLIKSLAKSLIAQNFTQRQVIRGLLARTPSPDMKFQGEVVKPDQRRTIDHSLSHEDGFVWFSPDTHTSDDD